MVWPFKPRAFLSSEDEAWHFEAWAFLLRHWGGMTDLKLSPLVAPTREFFPPSSATGHERALAAFERVKALAQMEAWPCRLEAQPERPDPRVSRFVTLVTENPMPLGTFGPDGDEIVITYDPGLLDDPWGLVATFAHELAHYRLAHIEEPPPQGEEMEEFLTDLAVAYLGFGLFGANTAFRFEQHHDATGQGWQTRGQGYLSERDWVFALAVFLSLRGEGVEVARSYLKASLFEDLRRALRYLDGRREALDALRAVEPVAPAQEGAQSA
jgi:hypothetical protein